MQTLEAILSFFIFVMIVTSFYNIGDAKIDRELYKYQLANDIWRVLYLKGDLHNFDKQKLNEDLERIQELTNLCVYFEEEDVASCIGTDVIVIEKFAFVDGEIEKITVVVGQTLY